jgi:hypothetical protein
MTLDYFLSAFFIAVPLTVFPCLLIKGLYEIIKKVK